MSAWSVAGMARSARSDGRRRHRVASAVGDEHPDGLDRVQRDAVGPAR